MARKRDVYWLSDAEWEAIKPHLPQGRRGAHRVDDRRVISGIMHMLRSGGRGRTVLGSTGPTRRSTIAGTAGAGRVCGSRFSMPRPARPGCLPARWTPPHQGPPLGGGRERGACHHAIGTSRGGRTTKIHALSDNGRRRVAFVLTPGNAHDLAGARALLAIRRPGHRLLADRAYDAASCVAGSPSAAPSPSFHPLPHARIPTPTTATPIVPETSSSACP